MDYSNPPLQPAPTNQPPGQPGMVPVDPFPEYTPPPPKSNKGKFILIIFALVVMIGLLGAAALLLPGKKETPQQEQTNQTEQPQSSSEESKDCAYIPKENNAANEDQYSVWREDAKTLNFDVYLPCDFHDEYQIGQLGVSKGDSDEVPNVFLTFRLSDTAQNKAGLPDESGFFIRALPKEHKPEASCWNSGSTSDEDRVSACKKLGDTSHGPVYQNAQGDVLLTINNALIIWTAPPYDTKDNVQSVINVLNSLKQVDATKLEFYNG